MTTVIAWRDPFCIVSDGVETNLYTAVKAPVGPKIRRLSESLAAGGSGSAQLQTELLDRVQALLPAPDWNQLEVNARQIVDDINARSQSPMMQVGIVVAGTIGAERGIMEWGQDVAGFTPLGTATANPFATIGTGGRSAEVARAIALRWLPRSTGEQLLEVMVEAAMAVDMASGKPIWRIDLENEATEPFKWLE